MNSCRICLEEDDDLIAPCACKGTCKYVHRECLDNWRNTGERDDAYTHCSECRMEYQLSSLPWGRWLRNKTLNYIYQGRFLIGIGVFFAGVNGIPILESLYEQAGVEVFNSYVLSVSTWLGVTGIPMLVWERYCEGNNDVCALRIGPRGLAQIGIALSFAYGVFFGSLVHTATVLTWFDNLSKHPNTLFCTQDSERTALDLDDLNDDDRSDDDRLNDMV